MSVSGFKDFQEEQRANLMAYERLTMVESKLALLQEAHKENKPSTSKYVSWEDFTQIQELINSNIADLNNELVDLRSRMDSQKDFLDEFQENTRQKFTQRDKGHGEEGKFFSGWLREVENKATTMRYELNNLKKVQVSIRVFLIICALILGVYFIAYGQIITCK